MEDFERLYNKALRFLSYRPRSEKEILQYLSRKTANKKLLRYSRLDRESDPRLREDDALRTIEKIIAKLKEQRFIDDEGFVRWWIEQRTTFKPRSLRLIKMELRQKGIDNGLIEKAIYDLRFKNYDDLNQAKELVERRIKRFRIRLSPIGMTREELYRKLGSYLARRGFDWDVIKQSIDEAISKGV